MTKRRSSALLLPLLQLLVLATGQPVGGDSTSTVNVGESPSFSDWLEAFAHEPAGASRKAQPSSYRMEQEHVCLKVFAGCPRLGSVVGRYDLTCCHGQQHQEQDSAFFIPGAAVPKIGHCTINTSPFLGLLLAPGVRGKGNFLATCSLNGNVETCGVSGCEDVVLSAQGEAYEARFVSTVPPPTITETCFVANRKREQDSPMGDHDLDNSNLPNLNNTLSSSKPRQDPPSQYLVFAYVYSGPMTITSKTREPKWREGWFDGVSPEVYGAVTPEQLAAEEAAAGGAFPRINAEEFWTYQLQFFQQGY